MSQCNYAYLDADGWVRQWSLEARPEVLEDGAPGPYRATPVEGLWLDLLPEGFDVRQNLRKESGVYVDKAAEAGPRPNEYAELVREGDALVWTVTVPLDDLKARKNADINAARLLANRTSFTYAGKAISCDELSRSDIEGTNGNVLLTGAFPANWPGGWKAMDNTAVPIADVATWTAFYRAMTDTGTANFNHAQDLKTQLAAATTPEEVAAIIW